MKLTIVLTCLMNLTVMAGIAQKVSLNEQNASLTVVLKKIKDQTGYEYMASSLLLKEAGRVNIKLQGAELKDALDVLFKDQPLSYELLNRTILIRPRSTPTGHSSLAGTQKTLSGTVFNATTGAPITGVTVTLKKSRRAVKTNAEGYFHITTTQAGDDVAIISCVGFTSMEVALQEHTHITLRPNVHTLEDVVSIGYGTARRKDLTGSVATVNVEEIRNAPFVSVDQALSGKAAGVQVTQSDGSPGGVARIRIRGGASLIGGNDPLYIIDGVQMPIQNRYIQSAGDIANPVERLGSDQGNMSNTVGSSFARGLNSLAGLNINDIESIDILKDASATAIYGSRAANGVVIITTKKGKHNQKPVLEMNYYAGLSSAITEQLLNPTQYKEMMLLGSRRLNALLEGQGLPGDDVATAIISNPDVLGTAQTDWMDLVTRTGRSQNVDLSIRGGGTGSRYYTSLAYADQKGTVLGTDFSRISGKINLDNEITDRIRLITNLDYGFTKNNITNGLYSTALFAPPTFAPFAEDGSPAPFDQASFGLTPERGMQNPMALMKGKNRSKNNMLLAAISLDIDILKDLKFRSTVSANYNNYHQLNYIPGTALVVDKTQVSSSKGGIGTQAYSNQLDMFYENTLTWNKQLHADHRINILAGTSWQKTNSNSFSASGQGFPDDDYLTGLSAAAFALPPTNAEQQNSLLSFYLRANYAWKERYLLTFTGRSDESSKYPKGNRTGYFPSVGLAWRLKEEAFLKDISWLNELKVRASTGRTGTQNLGDNLFYSLYSPASYASANALIPKQLGNDLIRWETTTQNDLGLDFELFGSRLRGALGYYEKKNSNLLMLMNTPWSSGFSSVMKNVANIDNKGIEIDLRGDIVRTSNFNWNLAINVSANRSKVSKILQDFSNPKVGAQTDAYIREQILGNTILREGSPVGLMFGYQYTGNIQNQEQLEAYQEASILARYGFLQNIGIGYPMYAMNEEGFYKGHFKRDVIGSGEPNYYGGITNSVTYKDFNLIATFTFSQGGDIMYLPAIKSFGLGDRGNTNTLILEQSYTDEHTDAKRPGLLLGEPNNVGASGSSNIAVFDGSYIKLKNITLNYRIPQNWMQKLRLNEGMLYASANNLFAITNYPGPDPEVSNDPYSLIGGYTDAGTYPSMRQFTLGLRFGF